MDAMKRACSALDALLVLSCMTGACGGSNASPPRGAAGGSGGADASGVDAGAAVLRLPQFVHGAARVDTLAFATVPLVVEVNGATPDAVTLAFDGAAPIAASLDNGRWVASVNAESLGNGTHSLVARATAGGQAIGSAEATLVVANASFQLTHFSQDGPAYDNHLVYDSANDQLALSWVSVASGQHQLYLNYFDGAFRRLHKTDIVLNAPGDEPLSGYTAFGQDGIGVVYRVQKPGDAHWAIKMRVVDRGGKELVPVMNLTGTGAAFTQAAAGVDPGGYSAAWLHITPATDPQDPPPVEIRFARWDTQAKKLQGPITLDSDQPAPSGSSEGPQLLEPLSEIGIACNSASCLVAYTRDEYNELVALNVAKLFVARVDLASGALAGPPTAVEDVDWDFQQFGQSLIALDDGSFALVYEATDTAAAVTPKSPCDESLERDLLYAVHFDAQGKEQGVPKPIFDYEGTREYPRIAAHPAGFALFWEDQRSECDASGGHIGMAMNVAAPDFSSLLDPYLEAPGSIGLPPEYPTLAVTGTDFEVSWSDDRDGEGVLDPKPEIFLESYWRK
jgi:hypothetical protein